MLWVLYLQRDEVTMAVALALTGAVHMPGIRRVALLDFDVHHGNGTEACLGRLLPQTLSYGLKTPLCQGQLNFKSFSPWLDVDDKDNFFFARYCTDRHHC